MGRTSSVKCTFFSRHTVYVLVAYCCCTQAGGRSTQRIARLPHTEHGFVHTKTDLAFVLVRPDAERRGSGGALDRVRLSRNSDFCSE